MQKTKLLNLLIIVTSLFGYLEWGKNNSSFLFEGEYEVLTKLFTDPASAAHPFTLIPLLGQTLLLVSLFQPTPNKYLSYIGIACLGLLLVLMTFIGLMEMNWRILISTLPFLAASGFAIRALRQQEFQMTSEFPEKQES